MEEEEEASCRRREEEPRDPFRSGMAPPRSSVEVAGVVIDRSAAVVTL